MRRAAELRAAERRRAAELRAAERRASCVVQSVLRLVHLWSVQRCAEGVSCVVRSVLRSVVWSVVRSVGPSVVRIVVRRVKCCRALLNMVGKLCEKRVWEYWSLRKKRLFHACVGIGTYKREIQLARKILVFYLT